MPSKSEKQARFMEMACKDPEFAKAHHISQEVACEFYHADQAKKQKEEEAKKPQLHSKKWAK